MGSKGSKPRKPPHHLDKVPNYEEPNTPPGFAAGSGYGSRYGHSAEGHREDEPSRFGRWVLKVLGKSPPGH